MESTAITSTDDYRIGPLSTGVYIFSSFVANAGVSVTGFGQALIFVFCVTVLGMLLGNDGGGDCQPPELCDTKHTVFLQSLSLVGCVPYLIYRSQLGQSDTNAGQAYHDNYHSRTRQRLLLYILIPVTLVSTPAGQWFQARIASPWIRIVLGIVISIVPLGKLGLRVCQQRQEAAQQQEAKEKSALLTSSMISENNGDDDDFDDDDSIEEDPDDQIYLYGSITKTIHSESTRPTDNHHSELGLPGISLNLVVPWGILLGCLSGFLGGLIGMRGPPLMVFFLVFPFPKEEARAVGAIMLGFNMVLRIAYYGMDDWRTSAASAASAATGGESMPWFQWSSSWQLYLGVVVAGIAGVPLGDWIHHQIDQNKFTVALGLLLAVSGVVNVAKGIDELGSSSSA